MVTNPTLPPKPGYVEIDLDGKRVYRNTSTGEIFGYERKPITIEDIQSENKLLKLQLQAQTDRSDFLEDCLAEMATIVYGNE